MPRVVFMMAQLLAVKGFGVSTFLSPCRRCEDTTYSFQIASEQKDFQFLLLASIDQNTSLEMIDSSTSGVSAKGHAEIWAIPQGQRADIEACQQTGRAWCQDADELRSWLAEHGGRCSEEAGGLEVWAGPQDSCQMDIVVTALDQQTCILRRAAAATSMCQGEYHEWSQHLRSSVAQEQDPFVILPMILAACVVFFVARCLVQQGCCECCAGCYYDCCGQLADCCDPCLGPLSDACPCCPSTPAGCCRCCEGCCTGCCTGPSCCPNCCNKSFQQYPVAAGPLPPGAPPRMNYM